MPEYSIEDLGRSVEHLTRQVGDLTETAEDNLKHESETEHKENGGMNNIAGLLALMQGNKGMDPAALLALCKDKGYDRGWGNEGMFMFVFLILFLFANGGWNNLGPNNRAAFNELSCGCGGNIVNLLSDIKDRVFDAQSSLSQQTQQLQTWLCQVTDAINAATRDQGDRSVAATQSVKDQLFQCCCDVKGLIAQVQNRVDGLYQHGDILHERTVNRINKLECDFNSKLDKLGSDMALGFERAQCDRHNLAKDEEIARLTRENAHLSGVLRDTTIARETADRMRNWVLDNYTPTRTQTGN